MKRKGSGFPDKALTEPLTISRNGWDRLVLLSVEEYDRLNGALVIREHVPAPKA